jgi:DNA-binding IclR family transcriptional regulator
MIWPLTHDELEQKLYLIKIIIMPTTTIQVLDRAVDLLDALARANSPISLKLLSLETGLHPSTAFRILASMHVHQLVYKNDRGDYMLGNKLCHYAQRLERDQGLNSCAEPVMHALGAEIQQPVYLSVRHGDELLLINSTLEKPLSESNIGQCLPLHLTSVGKLILAEMSDTELDSYIHRTGLSPMTEHSISEGGQLRQQLDTLRQQQLGLQREEIQLGSACLGVLIRDKEQQPVAGISVICQVQNLREHWGERLQQCANLISDQWQGLKSAKSS